ncbi:TrmB family transcriptional regulator [Haladaptatus sp. DYSN1]|uniref:TrmB family transcriptional regulator n=1 Tax=unclassified Haladaptatus TaxID=2622732 RepID=UPI002404B69B|nr:helix-turn-helix domain-containing protein [Haladaptatus sp. DYSN1]
MTDDDATRLLDRLDLKEYELTSLYHLLSLGRTTAPNLAEATGIPRARIYSVLEELGDKGFIKIIPGHPKQYQPKSPQEILDRAAENERQRFESYRTSLDEIRDEFLATFEPRYERASKDITPTEELFWAVDVGEPSETETRQLYQDATETVYVLTKSFEYLSNIEPALAAAIDRGVTVRVLFLDPAHLSAENRVVQRERVATLAESFPEVSVRFSDEKLPWRGTFIDPSMEYDSGRAILLVEEVDVPLHMRQAAVTDNGSFVAGLKRYFDLIWTYESVESPDETH